jgi:iron complex outermembrane receptor protein
VFLTPSVRSLEGITVTALRGEGARVDGQALTQSLVRQPDFAWRYSGQELPILLANTPSVTSYSDGGAYSNYTYFRIRGIDQTRVNITLDGVPLNDAEDQGVFFSNFPDLANSLESVQIQRGVGTSSHGVASYAGALHLETVSLAHAHPGAEAQISHGAFNTSRASAEWQSGRSARGFAAYGRLSWQETDGYRRNAGNRSTAGFLSAGYFGATGSAKLTALSGVSRNELAYLASSADALRLDPRNNPLPPQDRDRFRQSVTSLAVTKLMGRNASVAATAYSVSAGGDYDVTFEGSTSNFNLTSRMSGGFATYTRERGATMTTLGVHGSTYGRDHFLFARPDLATELYRNRGTKREASLFAKVQHGMGRLTLTGDVQLREAWYAYLPDRTAGVSKSAIEWAFVNPKVGATFALGASGVLYATLGSNGREPARNDMFAGFDNVDTTNSSFVGPLSRVRPERVTDVEAGWTWRGSRGDVRLVAFSMDFRNEITPIGQLSYIGLPLRKNVRRSYRRGVELDATYARIPRTVLNGNLAWSRNRLGEYTNDATGQLLRDVPPLLTPALVANHASRVTLWSRATLAVEGRYLAKSYLANDGDARFVVPASYQVDISMTQRLAALELSAQLRNATNRRILSGGYHDGSTAYYYISAPRNVTVTSALRF